MRLPVQYSVRGAAPVNRSDRTDYYAGADVQASLFGGIACRICKGACRFVPTEIGKRLCRLACDRTVCR
jgi:hypothetical protein